MTVLAVDKDFDLIAANTGPNSPAWPGGVLTWQVRHAVQIVSSEDGEQVAGCYLTRAWRESNVEIRRT